MMFIWLLLLRPIFSTLTHKLVCLAFSNDNITGPSQDTLPVSASQPTMGSAVVTLMQHEVPHHQSSEESAAVPMDVDMPFTTLSPSPCYTMMV
ncbi:hypothetical protein K438DRAFT_1819441 [Mycena galopus ATCC 62051]|nr:hypothetical protein K438DRAFT_1819441 [Mycena galopus ATCC 62051]